MARRRSSYYDDYWPSYAPTSPIRVEGGLKAKSQRGQFAKSWWADRWIEALTRLMDPKRLSRGQSYARMGQVLEIDVKVGQVLARVQGSRRTPYRVSIDLRPLGDPQWSTVFDALAAQAIFAAQLLNGEMPPDVEQVFDAVHVPLFPSSQDDLETDCSCPDWANPCKHIAAVYYLLGERFDEDPFLLFELRGQDKEQVIAALRERRAQGPAVAEEPAPYDLSAGEGSDAAPLEEGVDHYWALGPEAAELKWSIVPPQVEMALLKRLGLPDLMGSQGLWSQMARVYQDVSARALEKAFAESVPGQSSQEGEDNG